MSALLASVIFKGIQVAKQVIQKTKDAKATLATAGIVLKTPPEIKALQSDPGGAGGGTGKPTTGTPWYAAPWVKPVGIIVSVILAFITLLTLIKRKR
jgi:hypothetical protein